MVGNVYRQRQAVVLIVSHLTVGGLERVVIDLSRQLVVAGWEVDLLVLDANKRNILLTELDPDVRVTILSGSLVRRARSIRKLAHGRVVNVHLGDGQVAPMLRWLVRHSRLLVTCHSDYTHCRGKLANWVDRITLCWVDSIIAVSKSAARFLVNEVRVKPARVTIIENAVDIGRLRRCNDCIAPPQLRLVSVASLHPHKNVETLIRGLAEVRARGVRARLSVVGDGPDVARLCLLARTLGVTDAIDWYGAVWRRDIVMPIVECADIFVSASEYEGLPISLLEALALGKPCVLSRIAAHSSVAGSAGRYFAPRDFSEFAEHVLTIFHALPLRTQMSHAASDLSMTHTLAGQCSRYAELYRGGDNE